MTIRRLLVLWVAVVAIAASPAFAVAGNDNLADAKIAGAAYTDTEDTTGTTTESGEPLDCDMAGATVWYAFTPTAAASLVADTFGSDFDTVLTVYRTTAPAPTFGDLEFVACNDQAGGNQSRVGFDATAGETYYFQVGGWNSGLVPPPLFLAEPAQGSLVFNLNQGARISGTVTNAAGDPLQGICVEIFDASDEFYIIDVAFTGQDGGYSVSLAPGSYKVHFVACEYFAYDDEWYDNKQDYFNADVVVLDPGESAAGIDAILEEGPPPPPPGPQPDLDVTELTVTNTPIVTDYGQVGYSGWMRRVTATVTNVGEGTAVDSFFGAFACPQTLGDCSYLGFEYIESLEPGESKTIVVRWNGLGSVGDFTVGAYVWTDNDADYDNNYESVDHYVIVGGTGVGVGNIP